MNPAVTPALTRLFDAKAVWHEAMDAYYDPNTFRRKINNCIQELRNITFILQSNKKEIDGFEEWYKPWQDKMRDNKSLKWCLNSRNTVVKQQDLETFSTLKFEVIGSYLSNEVIAFEEMFDPELSIDAIYKKIHQCNLSDDVLYNSHIRLQRRWIDKNNPDEEIGELLAECWSFLANLLQDAPGVEKPQVNNNLLPPCMHDKLKDREKYFKVTEDGLLPVIMASNAVSLENNNQDEIRKRYKETPFFSDPALENLSFENFHEYCSFIFKQAKAMLQKDKYHDHLAFIFIQNKMVSMVKVVNSDRSEKYISMQKLASDMESIGADALIMISEAWIRKSLDEAPHGEALNLIGVNKAGEGFFFTAQFYRDNNDEITFGPDMEKDLQGINIIQPIINIWKK